MKVRPAMELFSHSTAKALQYLLPEYKEMADFFLLLNDGMDLLNTRTTHLDQNPLKCPFGSEYELQVKTLDKLCKNITELRIMNKRPCIKPFQRGFKLSCESLEGLFLQLKEPPVNIKYIMTTHCNQDYLESSFGAIRGVGRFNMTPLPAGAILRVKSLILASNIRCPKTGNIHSENDMVMYSSQRLTLMMQPVPHLDIPYEDEYILSKLQYIDPTSEVEVPVIDSLQNRAILGAKEYVAGFIAKRFLDTNPEMKSIGSREGWVNVISRRNLITPSDMWLCTFLKFEDFFNTFHKRRHSSAWDLNTEVRAITPLAKFLNQKYPSIPLKVTKYYVKVRTKIRISSINKKILLARREKRANAFINSSVVTPEDDEQDFEIEHELELAEEMRCIINSDLDEVEGCIELESVEDEPEWELLDI